MPNTRERGLTVMIRFIILPLPRFANTIGHEQEEQHGI